MGGGERWRGSEGWGSMLRKENRDGLQVGGEGQKPRLNYIRVSRIPECQQPDGSARKAQNSAKKKGCSTSLLAVVARRFGMLRALSQSDARHRPA